MPLRPLSDVSPADWFVESDAAWHVKVCLGPPGFEAYARVIHDLDEEAPADSDERLRADLRDILARHTTTPDDCFFGLWDGWGGSYGTGRFPANRRFQVPNRAYFLFEGPVFEAEDWGNAGPDDVTSGPHLIWPADHAWFAAADTDDDWIGIGGSQDLIDEILADPRFEAEVAAYGPSAAWTAWEEGR